MDSPTMHSCSTSDRPSITVIIAAYNRAGLLRRSICSALEQSLPALEILVIDDGSTDGTDVVARKLALADKRIRLIKLPHNLGPSSARNTGLDQARGDWIAILDADDICMPNRFARQVQFLQQNNLDLCGSWFVEFGQGLARTARWPYTEAALRAAMLFQSTICHPTVMARREVFDHYRYREEYRLAEDYDLFARTMADFRMANVPEVLLRYRRHPGQATQTQREAMEDVTRNIRLEILATQGIDASEDEQRLHNLIRAPKSISNHEDLLGVEAWLLKLASLHENPEAKKIVASQWVRACVRAAPLGIHMLRTYRASPLLRLAGAGTRTLVDLSILAAMKLDYRSSPFAALRRLGLSA
ncbi:glycosyltransferase family 2 protein [Rhodanobacter terrae]|uniref:Glycosyltransferase family 2 protein n=1 Tax=Rhodanobacter terrae TaxID=418647 RepID=A0ABW0SRG5_9GAMM